MKDLLHRRFEIVERQSWRRGLAIMLTTYISLVLVTPPPGIGYAILFAEGVLLFAEPR